MHSGELCTFLVMPTPPVMSLTLWRTVEDSVACTAFRQGTIRTARETTLGVGGTDAHADDAAIVFALFTVAFDSDDVCRFRQGLRHAEHVVVRHRVCLTER